MSNWKAISSEPATANNFSRNIAVTESREPNLADQVQESVSISCVWSAPLKAVQKVYDLKKPLILGYGNPDREDDGVAWHILRALTLRLGLEAPSSYEDEFPESVRIAFAFHLQLTPEMAEDIIGYKYICFVDAHTGNIPEAVRMVNLESEFQHSPFTHHLTPQSLLSMCETIYGKKPDAALLSVLGHRFLFSRQLSEETARLVPQAVELIWDWMNARDILK